MTVNEFGCLRRIKITKRLQELFELDDSDDAEQALDTPVLTTDIEQTKQTALSNLEKIESALEQVKGLVDSDRELDDIAGQAREAFNNLMDLGMQVDARFSAEIFNSASSFLNHALSAKTAKVNKKLKMIQLQLQKAELDRKTLATQQKDPGSTAPTDLGTGVVIDRNELIKQILSQNENNKPDKKDK